MEPYQPDRCDLIWLNFAPSAGAEQAGRRPALVLSPREFNIATGLVVACPITNQIKGSSFEVPLTPSDSLSGVVLSSHFRSLDWIARRAAFHGRATPAVMADVLARVAAILAIG